MQVLETEGFGFKFFLWDLLVDEYRTVARPDRVKYYMLQWDPNQLTEMLSKRLAAYSRSTVMSFASISDVNGADIDHVIALFSQRSPRNMIRLCKEILDQQSEINSQAKQISHDAIVRGFKVFAKNYTHETVDDGIIRDLQKMGRANFTVRYVYTDVFRFTQQAGMTKVRSWQDAGVVEQIGVVQETKGARPANHYALSHLLVLQHVFADLSIFDVIRRKLRICKCGQVVIREWTASSRHACQNCQREFQEDECRII